MLLGFLLPFCETLGDGCPDPKLHGVWSLRPDLDFAAVTHPPFLYEMLF